MLTCDLLVYLILVGCPRGSRVISGLDYTFFLTVLTTTPDQDEPVRLPEALSWGQR